MWNFIKSLLSNRFGIVMSAINMCLVIQMLMNHSVVNENAFHKLIFSLNLPSIILGIFSLLSFNFIFLDMPNYELMMSANLLLPLFVPIQWLFIGWMAKTIAYNVNKNG